ncbi:MAG: hypothetical protein J6T45_06105 [Fibrobacterales bacterium]|nr:hypothetical protein [Fibrobacterales bacterium]
MRANERTPEVVSVIKKLNACIAFLKKNNTDVLQSVANAGQPIHKGGMANSPARAIKLGAYVRNFFEWFSATGVAIPEKMVEDGLDPIWSKKTLGLWLPLFAMQATFAKVGRDKRRYWNKPFEFAGMSLYINSQWYGNKKGASQKAGFDRFAVELATVCGLSFLPYGLPGIPESQVAQVGDLPVVIKDAKKKPSSPENTDQEVIIHITSPKKKMARFRV